jgi:phage terminase large subunit
MEKIVVTNNYKPTEKAQKFHGSGAFFQVLVGGQGSGKSLAVIREIERTAIEHPGIPIAVYRKTLPSLRDSTLHEFKTHMDENMGSWGERDVKWTFPNKSFVNFRGLDQPSKAKSTEYGLIVMEEADEFTFEDFKYLVGRVRKKGSWPLRIILILNPVDEDHWIYKQFVLNGDNYNSNGGLLVLQFSTLDNLENLPENYIQTMTAGMTADEIDRYVHGGWGTIIKGEPVYAKLLKPDLHLYSMDRFPGQTLLRGWDFGFNRPASSFRLVDQLGRMNVAHCMMGDKEELDVFARRVLQETDRLFSNCNVFYDFGDPRGHDKAQNGKETCFEVLQSVGISAVGERGVRDYVEYGIKRVRTELSTLIEGIPQLTIDPGCALIRAAYFGKYTRDDQGYPRKDGYYDHICDADRYISHHHGHHSSIKEAMAKTKSRQRRRAFNTRSQVTGY